jgi:DNA helicase-2/ATP-dependent DNA helicase PcrA
VTAVTKLAEVCAADGRLAGFTVSAFGGQGGAGTHLNLMTLHSAKGLEFPVVFVTGLEEKLFPLNPDDSQELEEERRLFYVALTRAEKKLYVSYAKNRYRFGQLMVAIRSRFLDELDGDVVVTESGTKLYEKRDKEAERSRYDYSSYQDESYGSSFSGSRPKKSKPAKTSFKSSSQHSATQSDGLKIGMKVQHKLFGSGKVIALQGSGDAKKARVFFERVGEKTLVLKFANLLPL